MALPIDCTIYTPGKPLNQQLQLLDPNQPKLYRPSHTPPFQFGHITFKPLNVNGILLHLTLFVRSTLHPHPDGIAVYHQYTFHVTQHGENRVRHVPAGELDTIISHLFETMSQA